MTVKHSTRKRAKSKQAKPHKDFPLFAHASGQWAKKVKGKLHYFGTDPQAASEKWLRQKDDLLAGRTPRDYDSSALTVADLCNQFLASRERKVKSGELAQCTFDDYLMISKQITDQFGRTTAVESLRPEDFAELRDIFADGCNLKTLEGRVARARAIFNHAEKNGLIERSLSKLWGTEFDKPSRTALQKLSNENGERMFTPKQIHALLDYAGPQISAMILLGVNCAYGNTDCGRLRLSHVDFESGFVSLPRSKTGKVRRCPLWPETVKALTIAIQRRPKPTDEADSELVFITKAGNSWLLTSQNSPLSKEFSKLKTAAKIKGRGLSFYTLRHVFQTIGDEAKDPIATSAIMGHVDSTISGHYREKISDERLLAVTNHVRKWLFGSDGGKD